MNLFIEISRFKLHNCLVSRLLDYFKSYETRFVLLFHSFMGITVYKVEQLHIYWFYVPLAAGVP